MSQSQTRQAGRVLALPGTAALQSFGVIGTSRDPRRGRDTGPGDPRLCEDTPASQAPLWGWCALWGAGLGCGKERWGHLTRVPSGTP